MKKTLITILIIVILAGAGYFAYSKGLIKLDFLKKGEIVEPVEVVENQQEKIIKPEELKNKYVITYKDEEYKVKEDATDNYIVSKRNLPIIINGVNQKAADKITNSLTEFSNDEWDSLKKASNDYSDSTYDDLGATYIISTGIVTDGRLTFTIKLDGNFGGAASWIDEVGYNYDANTGELLTLTNISFYNNNEVKNIIKNYLSSKVEEKFNGGNSCIFDDWKNDLEKDFDNYSWYFTSEGIKIIIPQYGIACMADGMISVMVDKDSLNNYLKNEYKF